MKIRTNGSSLRAFRESSKTSKSIAKNLEKLSSGLQINRAADDAAGLSISEKMRAKITELDRCQNNALEGQDIARTADGALAEINDMLCRARGLCIEAANGTYSDQELSAISNELNALFEEIDRITEGSYHNSIQLFRGNVEPDYRDVILENFQTLPSGAVEPWGTMEFIATEEFEPAEPAHPASASFQLDDSIDLNDASTLEGKSIQLQGYTYYFTKDVNSAPSGTRVVSLANRTAEDALKALASVSSSDAIDKVEVDAASRIVTLTAPLKDLQYPLTADGSTSTYTAKGGNGEMYNGVMLQNPTTSQNTLLQVDGDGILNNLPIYSAEAKTSFSLNLLKDPITQDEIDNLKENSLVISGSIKDAVGNSTSYKSKTISLSGVAVTAGMTKEQVGNAIAQVVQNTADSDGFSYGAVYNAATGALDVTLTQTSAPARPLSFNISELTKTVSSTPETKTLWTSSSLGVTCSRSPGTAEKGEVYTVTIPSSLRVPFSFELGYYTYLYYNSDEKDLTNDEYTQSSLSSYVRPIDTKDLSDIRSDIIEKIKNYANGLSNVDTGKTVVSGNTVTFTSNVGATLSPTIRGTTVNVNATKWIPGTGTPSEHVLNTSSSHFSQTVSVSFELGSDASALVGKGFSVDSQKFEFTDGAGVNSTYIDIDVSSGMDQVIEQIKARLGNVYTVAWDGQTMQLTRNWTTYYSLGVTDGSEGIIARDSEPITFSGGTNVGYSQKTLDFSSINEDNLDTLLGKGFRISCATCEGEYINVFFCWEASSSLPPTFDRWDAVNGENRTIHNIPVELSKVKSGDKIVESIVEQVRPTLTHYTDVEIGDPPTTLIARDKRLGGYIDASGKLLPGKVHTGLEANFTYSVSFVHEKVIPPNGEVALKTDDVKIYVGSDPEAQYIDVHLPYIDLEWLRLNPPEIVDLTAADQDPSDWLAKVDHANIAISDARGTIGADFNRLEHAWQDLNQADIQLTDAESRIRDADIAQLMMEQTKLEILSQSQRSMLAQANMQPEQVLQLLA